MKDNVVQVNLWEMWACCLGMTSGAALFSNSTRILCNMDGILHHW